MLWREEVEGGKARTLAGKSVKDNGARSCVKWHGSSEKIIME
jgi:hypothetical protein